jgi:hypothetical protein
VIYVDEIVDYGQAAIAKGLPSKCWAHLTADTRDELHPFARKLGLDRGWFQDDRVLWHYDVTAGKRARALQLGAEAIDWRAMGELIGRRRAALDKPQVVSQPISATPQWLTAVAAAGGQCECVQTAGHKHPKDHDGRCVRRNTINAERLYLAPDKQVYCVGCFDYHRSQAQQAAAPAEVEQDSLF